MDFLNLVKDKITRIETHLETLFPNQDLPEKILYDAARYSVLGGGKRIRPLLTLLSAESIGGNLETALAPGCALELIHGYSLIHDDLPCMDDDDFRRGKPSLHKKFTEGHAVLTGDYLLTYSFELIARDPLLKPEQKVQIIQIMAERAGGTGMIGGQVLDIHSPQLLNSLEHLQLIHAKKTGALLSAAVEIGAICGNANSSQSKCLKLFGEKIGLAFQIIDDILDVTQVENKRGSKISSDIKNQKVTYVTLIGLEKARDHAKNTIDQAVQSIQSLGKLGYPLIQLAEYLTERTK